MGERFKNLSKSFVCSFANCKAAFSKLWKLEAHYCKHTGLKPFACDRCDKSFCTRYQLTRHNLSHSGEKPYRCSVDVCTESFSSSAGLKNHVARVHQHKEKHYVCDHDGCGKEFNKNRQLKAHKCEHTNLLPYECPYEGCEKKFVTSKALKKHEKVHDGYPCAQEGCTFQGKTWNEYQLHRKSEHRDTFQCDSCPRVFHEAWFLKKHQQFVHSGARRVFSCPRTACQKTYTTHFNLQNHILSFHEGQRSFVCAHPGCGKAFAMEESLKRHAVAHDPQKKKLQKETKPGRKKRRSKANVSNASELSARLQNVSLNKSTPQKNPKP